MHPAWLRCSSLTYSRYARSSRLATRAPRRPGRHTYSVTGPNLTNLGYRLSDFRNVQCSSCEASDVYTFVVSTSLPHTATRFPQGRRRGGTRRRRAGATRRSAFSDGPGHPRSDRRRAETPHPAEGRRRAQPRPEGGRLREG